MFNTWNVIDNRRAIDALHQIAPNLASQDDSGATGSLDNAVLALAAFGLALPSPAPACGKLTTFANKLLHALAPRRAHKQEAAAAEAGIANSFRQEKDALNVDQNSSQLKSLKIFL